MNKRSSRRKNLSEDTLTAEERPFKKTPGIPIPQESTSEALHFDPTLFSPERVTSDSEHINVDDDMLSEQEDVSLFSTTVAAVRKEIEEDANRMQLKALPSSMPSETAPHDQYGGSPSLLSPASTMFLAPQTPLSGSSNSS